MINKGGAVNMSLIMVRVKQNFKNNNWASDVEGYLSYSCTYFEKCKIACE